MEYTEKIELLNQMYQEVSNFHQKERRETVLRTIHFWHARSRGKLEAIFSDNKDILDHWDDINFDWDDQFYFYTEMTDEWEDYVPVPEELKDYKHEDDDYSPIPEVGIAFTHYCWHRVKWCRDSLLRYVSIVESEHLGVSKENGLHENLPLRPEIPSLGFIENEYRSLKSNAEHQMNAALKLYEAGEPHNAVIILGSALEALFFGLIMSNKQQSFEEGGLRQKNKEHKFVPIEDWRAEDLNFRYVLEAAHKIGWIRDEGKRMANDLWHYRNHFHPSRDYASNDAGNEKNNNSKILRFGKADFLNGWSAILKCVDEINAWQSITHLSIEEE